MGEQSIALVEEAVKKSGLLWLELPGLPQPRAAWHVWHDGSLYVLTGGEGEQPLPGLAESDRIRAIVPSKDKGGRLVTFDTECSIVEPGTDLWDEVVPLLVKARLNGTSDQAERWRTESWVVRLTPDAEIAGPAEQPADYATVRPVPSPATTAGPPPRLRGSKKRAVDR
ncbi:hypothetical protein [Actinomadura flavalba]|uniref:hypothetical protein n=1 Tax=Actinomadura flavalba TaxID=1120938 RepID=UPI00037AA252|nr:hypothetical protein [Actinomadura flavalba]